MTLKQQYIDPVSHLRFSRRCIAMGALLFGGVDGSMGSYFG
ncbi:hypothetical protein [Lutimonas sp.]